MKVDRPPVPIVVVLYHREEEAGKMFRQLSRVTGNYSLIIVNNGFDDHGLVKELEPLHYVENLENTGAIRGINQGLDLAEGKYAAVLHSDVLIYDEGWLDHIVEFMDRRPDVGLVGLGGFHRVEVDGSCRRAVDEVDMEGWRPDQPVWRFTEVAAIKGAGWVSRAGVIRLDESCDTVPGRAAVDLSFQYQELGFNVYSANVEHECQGSGEDDVDTESRARLAEKWSGLLPLERAYSDEKRFAAETKQMGARLDELRLRYSHLEDRYKKLAEEARRTDCELESLAERARELEGEYAAGQAELEFLNLYYMALEGALASPVTGVPAEVGETVLTPAPRSLLSRFVHHARTRGMLKALNKSAAYVRRGIPRL